MKKVLVLLLLGCSFAACSSFNSFKEDDESTYNCAADIALVNGSADVYTDISNVGSEHNEALQMLMDAFPTSDFDFNEAFTFWINLVDEKCMSLGNSLSDEEISSLWNTMFSFYVQCLQYDGVRSALHQLISTYECEEEFRDELHALVNNLDFEYGQREDFIEQIEILEGNTAGAYYSDEYLPYVQSFYYIADASYDYWTEYYYENGEFYTVNDSTAQNEDRAENLKTLRCNVVDVLAGAGAASTGVGVLLSGVVGAFASFLWAEAVENIEMVAM